MKNNIILFGKPILDKNLGIIKFMPLERLKNWLENETNIGGIYILGIEHNNTYDLLFNHF